MTNTLNVSTALFTVLLNANDLYEPKAKMLAASIIANGGGLHTGSSNFCVLEENNKILKIKDIWFIYLALEINGGGIKLNLNKMTEDQMLILLIRAHLDSLVYGCVEKCSQEWLEIAENNREQFSNFIQFMFDINEPKNNRALGRYIEQVKTTGYNLLEEDEIIEVEKRLEIITKKEKTKLIKKQQAKQQKEALALQKQQQVKAMNEAAKALSIKKQQLKDSCKALDNLYAELNCCAETSIADVISQIEKQQGFVNYLTYLASK